LAQLLWLYSSRTGYFELAVFLRASVRHYRSIEHAIGRVGRQTDARNA